MKGYVLWFVSEDHFGQGPFRWLLYQGEETLATSDPFNLPDKPSVMVQRRVTVEP